MLHRPADAYSVDLFWEGTDREFSGWYINLQDPIRRYERGFETLDHELDYWLKDSGSWSVKDDELFEQRVKEGRYSEEQAVSIRSTGSQVVDMLSTGSNWWDESWAHWTPPSHWQALDLPEDWQATGKLVPGSVRVHCHRQDRPDSGRIGRASGVSGPAGACLRANPS